MSAKNEFIFFLDLEFIVDSDAKDLVGAAIHVLARQRGVAIAGIACRDFLGVVLVGGPEIAQIQANFL